MSDSYRFKALMLSFPILFLLAGCGGRRVIGTQSVVERSGNLPEWTVKVPKTRNGMMFFRGLKTGAVSLEAALTDARMHATRQVAEMVQTEANIDYENARVEYGLARDDADIGSVIRDGIIMLSDAIVQGVKEKESYWEKVEEVTPTGVQYLYNLYTLISLSEDDYKRIAFEVIERQKEEARARNNEKAEKFLDGFREEILERNFFREGE